MATANKKAQSMTRISQCGSVPASHMATRPASHRPNSACSLAPASGAQRVQLHMAVSRKPAMAAGTKPNSISWLCHCMFKNSPLSGQPSSNTPSQPPTARMAYRPTAMKKGRKGYARGAVRLLDGAASVSVIIVRFRLGFNVRRAGDKENADGNKHGQHRVKNAHIGAAEPKNDGAEGHQHKGQNLGPERDGAVPVPGTQRRAIAGMTEQPETKARRSPRPGPQRHQQKWRGRHDR